MAAIQGKWYADRSTHNGESYPDGDGTVRFVYATQPNGEKYIVAKVWSGDDGDYESTARLIAAAPQLLEACKRMMFMIQDFDRVLSRNPGIIFDAMGAIRQAQGDK